MADTVSQYWHYFLILVSIPLAFYASTHALIHKRHSHSALLWISFIWFLPLVGSALYFLLGINRIQRRATSLRASRATPPSRQQNMFCAPRALSESLPDPESATRLCALANTVGNLTQRPLLTGNQVLPLVNGDEAFPRMWEAITEAKKTICLSTYIFDHDDAGLQFAHLLAEAQQRGVEVRILVDSTGARYSWPPITDRLTALRLRHANFFPASKLNRTLTLNMHNHRKIMVVDGKVGFTGGMNIRHANQLQQQPKRPVQDIHFELKGSIVSHLQQAFAEDWAFATGERLTGKDWFPRLRSQGEILARGITDGPDADLDILTWTLIGGLNAATKNIRIVTPYFLPETRIIAALNAAALRGVRVQILIPEKNNLPFMSWATAAMLWQLLQKGCRVYRSPSPFDHTKLLTVDDEWTLIGSANWDARSLRLNFEFNVECYSRPLAQQLNQHIDEKLAAANEVTLQSVENRPFPIKLRDSAVRLLSPLL